MHEVFLGIGGNIGNKYSNFNKAYKLIETTLGEIIRQSSIYESPPWGFDADENFWNQVLLIETIHSPLKLLDKIKKIQSLFKRKQVRETYASREMDIDILYYDKIIMESDILVIPHNQIQNRLFVLVPLAEIAPRFVHPLLGMTTIELIDECKDSSVLSRIELN